jgi:hypothetical protein
MGNYSNIKQDTDLPRVINLSSIPKIMIKSLGHSNVFICFASFENPKNLPARKGGRKTNKRMQIF